MKANKAISYKIRYFYIVILTACQPVRFYKIKLFMMRTHLAPPGAVLGGGPNRGQCPSNSESGPSCSPPDRESAIITQ